MARILSKDTAVDRIAYLYANPSNDNLEDSIEKYPGLSTFSDLLKCHDSLNASVVEWIPNFRVPALPQIGSRAIGLNEEREILKALGRISNKKKIKKHALGRHPNGWMKSFRITEEKEVSELNAQIVSKLRASEQRSREARKETGKTVFGAARLRRQPIMADHTPKKKERKIFFLGNDPAMRIAEALDHEQFEIDCRECFQRALCGEIDIEWPPGAFRPPLPPKYNVLFCFDDDPLVSFIHKKRPKDFLPAAG